MLGYMLKVICLISDHFSCKLAPKGYFLNLKESKAHPMGLIKLSKCPALPL